MTKQEEMGKLVTEINAKRSKVDVQLKELSRKVHSLEDQEEKVDPNGVDVLKRVNTNLQIECAESERSKRTVEKKSSREKPLPKDSQRTSSETLLIR